MRTLIILFLYAFLSGPTNTSEKWLVDSGSSLIISGKSNVNAFTCSTRQYSSCDTIEYAVKKNSSDIHLLQNILTIPLQDFDCGSAPITHDFLASLQATKYPDLKIHFLTLDDLQHVVNGQLTFGQLVIELAGERKSFDINFETQKKQPDNVTLTGQQRVAFSDFKLEAPRKMMGLIKVDEYLDVKFEIKLVRL